jgi:hypothetical protein
MYYWLVRRCMGQMCPADPQIKQSLNLKRTFVHANEQMRKDPRGSNTNFVGLDACAIKHNAEGAPPKH